MSQGKLRTSRNQKRKEEEEEGKEIDCPLKTPKGILA